MMRKLKRLLMTLMSWISRIHFNLIQSSIKSYIIIIHLEAKKIKKRPLKKRISKRVREMAKKLNLTANEVVAQNINPSPFFYERIIQQNNIPLVCRDRESIWHEGGKNRPSWKRSCFQNYDCILVTDFKVK